MPVLFRPILATCLTFVAVLGGTQAPAASLPRLSQLEAVAIDRAKADDETGSAVDALAASLEDGEELRLDFLRSLFTDPAARRHAEKWLRTLPGDFDLHSEWARHFRSTMAAATSHLSRDEVEFIFASFFAPMAVLDRASCARLTDPATPKREVASALGLTRAIVAEFYRILSRTYMAAITNLPPPAAAGRSAMEAAQLEALSRMSPVARELLLGKVGTREQPSAARGCEVMIATAMTLKDMPGESGALMRRDFVASLLQPEVVPQTPAHATTSVQGASSSHFEPGSATLEYPVHAARAGIEGRMTVKVWIDDEGRATRVRTIKREFNLPAAKLADGTEISVEEMFDPIVSVFYKSGRFMRRFKDGVPHAYEVEIPISWKLKD